MTNISGKSSSRRHKSVLLKQLRHRDVSARHEGLEENAKYIATED